MAYKISGTLEEDARLIVFDEVTGSIEHNELTASGTYEISDLSENNKTIIARNSEGESYGYGAVVSIEGTGSLTATGGTITSYESEGITYNVHTFTSGGTFEVTSLTGSPEVDYLIIGGGGGGGWAQAGGGAAGWLETGQIVPSIQNYSVVIGAGGEGGSNSVDRIGGTGGLSSFGNITVSGGPGGETNREPGPSSNNYDGGLKWTSGSFRVCIGGGAGAGGDGGDGSSDGGGDGGDGVLSGITGSDEYYGGGGGGGCYSTVANYLGGSGGSGVGGYGGGTNTNVNPSAGAANTGSGGGGGSQSSSIRDGADGGSGVLIIRYQI